MNENSNPDDTKRPATIEQAPPLVSNAHDLVPAQSGTGLPALPATIRRPSRRRWIRVALALAVLAVGAGGAYYWWQRLHPPLPPGIAFGNGRLEADEINIDTKYAARIGEILADEGDLVKAGQVVARMDTRDLQASLKRAEATVRQARRAVDEANANVAQQKAQVLLAQQEFERATTLLKKGFQTQEVVDQRQQQLDGANAALEAATARVTESEHALEAATHDVELYSVQIADDTLVAPRDGRIQYRIANLGEVLPAGGHVFAMLDTSYVYMDIYLPTQQAGKGEIRRRCPHRGRRLSECGDPRQGHIHRHAGPVHAKDGRDPDRARQADVSRARAHRCRLAARADRCREQRAARRRLRLDRCRREVARLRCKGQRRNERACHARRRTPRERHAALRPCGGAR